MEAKGERYFNGGQKTGKKRASEGSDDGPGKRPRLDAMTVNYFRRVSTRLNEGFDDDEERDLFVENVLSEVKDKANSVANNLTGSLVLEKLLSLATSVQVGEVLAELGGETGSEFKSVACDKRGGHVIESALRQAHRWAEENQAKEDSDNRNTDEEESGILEVQVQRLCGVIRENIEKFLKDPYGSHVVRTLVHVLGGCLAPKPSDAQQAKTDKKLTTEMTDFEIPTSFWWELKYLSDSIMEHISVCVTNQSSSLVLQTLLTVCHRKRPILCKKIQKGIMGYLTSLGSASGVSPLLVFLKDPACSHLLQMVFSFSHKALLCSIYKNHLRTQLVSLALHPIANFTIQTLIAASSDFKVFPKIFNELMEGFEAVLAAKHMGVIVQLTESCVRWEEKQDVLMQRLLQVFHCSERERQTSCLPLFLALQTYEVYYNTETAGGDADTQRPLSICYHGSRMVQALANFKDKSILMNSLRKLSSANLLLLGTDSKGSHALQALVTSASNKSQEKLSTKLKGLYVQFACSKVGSRMLEAVWNSATISHKQIIAQHLVTSEKQIRTDQFGRHVWAKFGLTRFKNLSVAWLEFQAEDIKKREMFRDILE